MNKKFIAIIYLLLAIPLVANGQIQQLLIGFQDIPWGSSVQAVKVKFPQVKPYDACKNAVGISEKSAKEGFEKLNMNCISYSIEKYSIDRFSFNLVFTFDVSNALNDVTVSKYVSGVDSVSMPECNSAFVKLNDILSYKYGAGQQSSVDLYGFKALGFQNLEAKVWVLGQTQLYLSNASSNPKAPDLCWVNLSYSPSRQSNASKL